MRQEPPLEPGKWCLGMGRRRKRRKKIVKRRTLPPRYFQCPRCGSMTLTVDFKKTNRLRVKKAIVRCGTCGLHCEFEVPDILDRVDVYNKVVDLAYEDRLEECMAGEGEGSGDGEAVGEAEETVEGD